MMKEATEAANAGQRMTMVLPPKFKRPPKFPRGELLCETERGRVYTYDPLRVLAWLTANGLITMRRVEGPRHLPEEK